MMVQDNFRNDPLREVLFQFKRYRVTKSYTNGVYTMWYGGTILKIDRDRRVIMERFKQVMENFEACAS